MSAYRKPRRSRRKKKLIKPLVSSPQTTVENNPQTTVVLNPKAQEADTQMASSRYRTTSLKTLVEKEETKQTPVYNLQSKDANSDFSQEDLVKYWIEYANSLTTETIHLKNTLYNCKPVLTNHPSFEISVYNPSQRDEIFEKNAQIIAFLCSKLNNKQIKMEISIVEKEEIEMIYTAAEKYDYLSKKNPNIEKLRELFNLTIE